jgi:hypothetical protein
MTDSNGYWLFKNCFVYFCLQKIIFVFAFLICGAGNFAHAQSQTNIADTVVNAKLLSLAYTFQIPMADMADRFGSNNNLGASFTFKMAHNFLLGVEASFLFGGNIKEDTILDGLFTSQGFLIGTNGFAESVILFEGYSVWGNSENFSRIPRNSG